MEVITGSLIFDLVKRKNVIDSHESLRDGSMETSAAGLPINHLFLTELWKRCSQERSGMHIHTNTHSKYTNTDAYSYTHSCGTVSGQSFVNICQLACQ